jgi:ribonucleotide monophosphatase NagD (HAD superfamily)
MGLPSARDELITSLGACRSLVESRGLRPFLLLSPEAAEEFAGIDTRPPHNAVVLGLYPAGFDYEHLNTAFRILKREPLCDGETDTAASAIDAPSAPVLIAPHKAAYHQAPASSAFPAGLSLGIGAYVRALEDAAGVTAEVVGKPTASFYALAMARMEAKYGIKLDAADVAIVGDDVNNDLGAGAVELGLKRILGELLRDMYVGWLFSDTSAHGQIPRGRRGRHGGAPRSCVRYVCGPRG